jgi:hypothetical protein
MQKVIPVVVGRFPTHDTHVIATKKQETKSHCETFNSGRLIGTEKRGTVDMGLDAQQKELILTSELSALVFGRGEDFVLFRLDKEEQDETIHQQIAERRLNFCGVFGFRNGEAIALLATDNPSAAYPACFAGLAFARIVADRLKEPRGDGVEWLERLWRMDS